MFKAISRWFDRVMDLPEGWGFPIALLTLAVLLQWVALGIDVARRLEPMTIVVQLPPVQ